MNSFKAYLRSGPGKEKPELLIWIPHNVGGRDDGNDGKTF